MLGWIAIVCAGFSSSTQYGLKWEQRAQRTLDTVYDCAASRPAYFLQFKIVFETTLRNGPLSSRIFSLFYAKSQKIRYDYPMNPSNGLLHSPRWPHPLSSSSLYHRAASSKATTIANCIVPSPFALSFTRNIGQSRTVADTAAKLSRILPILTANTIP